MIQSSFDFFICSCKIMCKPMGKFAENLNLGKHVLPPPLVKKNCQNNWFLPFLGLMGEGKCSSWYHHCLVMPLSLTGGLEIWMNLKLNCIKFHHFLFNFSFVYLCLFFFFFFFLAHAYSIQVLCSEVRAHPFLTWNTFEIWGGTLLESGSKYNQIVDLKRYIFSLLIDQKCWIGGWDFT